MNLKENTQLMKNQTWGAELECVGLTCRQAINVVADYYGTTSTIRSGGSWEREIGCQDSKGRMWWAHHDGSVRSNGSGDFELVTPIMTYEDIEDMQAIIRKLRENGALSSNYYGCGLHIHVGAFNVSDDGAIHDAKSLRNLANIMFSHDKILIKAINISSSRYGSGGYCRVINEDFINALNRTKPNTIAKLKGVYAREIGTRYVMLNYDSLDDNKTVEFRLFEFHRNLHAGEFKAYLHLCLAMSNYAKMVRYCRPQKVDMSNEKNAMKNWLNNLGLIGDEFKTTRKMLMKRLSGDSAYKVARNSNTIDDLDVSVDG